MLDMHKIKQGEDALPVTKLPPINGSFFDDPTLKAVAENFLKKFVPLLYSFLLSLLFPHSVLIIFRYYDTYDSARDSLVGAYAEQACFSLTHIPTSQVSLSSLSSFSFF